ncbi:MAG: NAD(P)/FAD-dependent oxidoreductase, partial [Myxococcales bacterium]|nr:NAD(P)/FAD-dependent oxidoreductase [Myxococcales bacterium]
MTQHVTVAIIGTGFGGQAAAIRLKRLGITDFVMLERRPFMGGTWLQNTYPGAAVDVPSPLYSLAGEPWDWSQMYADQAELAAYTEAVIERHGLRAHARLETTVTGLVWQADAGHWRVETDRGAWTAQFVINASGPLSKPVIPEFPGRDTFAGPAFHTNHWDHGVDLRGKRVAVIGSGASAAQVIPALVDQVAELHVFQRTPHWVMPRADRVFTPRERAALRRAPARAALRAGIYWKLESRVLGLKYSKTLLKVFAEREALAHLAAQVPDEALRAKLTPDYAIGCKRVILSNTLLPALAHPNTTLHDRLDGVARIHPGGILTAGGRDVALDVLAYATGFDATDDAISYGVTGEGGRTLAASWAEFPRAYLGTAVPGFPNLFIVTGPNTGIGHTSALFIIESQMNYIMACLQAVRAAGARSVAVKAEAEAAYTARIHREMRRTVWQAGGCRSWYQ